MIERAYCFSYIVLNAGTYLDFSLASIMNLVKLNPKSGVIIVEGADQFSHPLEKTENGLSIDGTKDIIDKWLNCFPERIMYSRLGNVKDKRDLRNATLDLARNNFDVQYIWGVDGDELMKVDDFLKIDEIIAQNPNSICYWLKHNMFWGDFGHRCNDADAGYKESIFYNAHNLKYTWWHTQVSLNDSPPISQFMPASVLKIEMPFYHYGCLTSARRLFMKRLYSYAQLQWFVENIAPCSFWDKIQKEGGVWESFFHGEPYENKPFFKEIESFPLAEHPAEIKKHPWFGKSSEEIWASEEIYPTFEYVVRG